MKTYMDCIPCFFKQVISASEALGTDEVTTKKIIDKTAIAITKMDLSCSPPEMGMIIQKIIQQELSNPDPYKALKDESNRIALSIRPQCVQMIKDSSSPLLTAVELAIAGNIIDYGAQTDLDPKKEILNLLDKESKNLEKENNSQFDFSNFTKDLHSAKTLLYLGDNTGEIIFDGLLIEEIKRELPDLEIIFAARDRPILNDATKEDAYLCGIDKDARIISSGSDAPGTLLNRCNKEFLELYHSVDLIISKGQGNFEALSDEKEPIYFLFMAKCDVMTRHNHCNLKDIILKRTQI